jgi:hypothetical protein
MHANSKEENVELWIGDTGATAHMSNSPDGFEQIKYIETKIKLGNGDCLSSPYYGNKRIQFIQKDKKIEMVLSECKFVPDLFINLLSLTQAMKKGFSLMNDGLDLILQKDNKKIILDQIIKNANGNLIGVKAEPTLTTTCLSTSNTSLNTCININELHRVLGHPGEKYIHATAKLFGWKIIGNFETCEACAIAKAKQKNINKFNDHKTDVPGERFYIDVSYINEPTYGGSKYWLLIVDEATKFKWSYFLKTKDEVATKVIALFNKLSNEFNKNLKFIRCDNAGENISLQKQMEKLNLSVTFEFTAPNTPQQNGVVERAFATLYGRVRAMMRDINLPEKTKIGLWAECASTATYLDNIMSGSSNEKNNYEKFFGTNINLPSTLHPFGSEFVIANRKKIKSKLEDRGEKCFFVGYAVDHASDVFRFFKLSTKQIILSRDAIYLKRNKEQDIIKNETVDYELGRDNVNVNVNKNEKKVNNALKKLNTFFNPTIQGLSNYSLMSAIDSGYTEPQDFEAAWHHNDAEERKFWQEAIKKELQSMIEKGVWQKANKNNIPDNRRLLGTKWVFKKKSSGVFRARLVALGYNQVPGVDYSANYSPVINEVTMRIILLMKLIKNWSMELIDVETAFLYGDLDEEIYLKLPSGYQEVFGNEENFDCLLLKKSLYGLVQAARQWWKQLAKHLQNFNYMMSDSDPCLFYRNNNMGNLILCIYVDDILCIGEKQAIDFGIKELENYFKLK